MDILFLNVENAITQAFEDYAKQVSNKYSIDYSELKTIWDDMLKGNKKVLEPIKNSSAVKKETTTAKTSASSSLKKQTNTVKTSSPVIGHDQINKILRINKEIDKLWNADTQLVFKSPQDRIVIGHYRDEKFEPINETDIELCKKYKFKYDLECITPKTSPCTKSSSVSTDSTDSDSDSDDEIQIIKKPLQKKLPKLPQKVETVKEVKKISNAIKPSVVKNLKDTEVEDVISELQEPSDNDTESDMEPDDAENYDDESVIDEEED